MFMMVFPFCCRSTGLPSPLSPIPSPAGSVSSQPGSNDSNGVGHSSIGNSTGSTVTVSCHISSVTSSYVNITSYILHAYEIWEKADALARKNKGKFCPLFFLAHVSWLCVYLLQSWHSVQQEPCLKFKAWNMLNISARAYWQRYLMVIYWWVFPLKGFLGILKCPRAKAWGCRVQETSQLAWW